MYKEEEMHPFDFMTKQEKSDYDEAPYTSDGRTIEQRNAVLLYYKAKKYINNGSSEKMITEKVEKKRNKMFVQGRIYPKYFMTGQERYDYDEAPYSYEDRDSTPEQAKAVRLHQRINEAIAECSDWDEVTARVQQHHREIYGDQGSEEGTSSNHEQYARSDTSSNHEQDARSDTSSNHEQDARSDTSSNHEQDARSDTAPIMSNSPSIEFS